MREKQGSKPPISKSSTGTKPTTPKTTAAAKTPEAAETTTTTTTTTTAGVRKIPLLGVTDLVPDASRGPGAPQHFPQQYTQPQIGRKRGTTGIIITAPELAAQHGECFQCFALLLPERVRYSSIKDISPVPSCIATGQAACILWLFVGPAI